MKLTKLIFLFWSGLVSSLSSAEEKGVEFTAPTQISVNESAGTTASQQGMGQYMSMMQGASHINTGRSLQASCCSGRDFSCCGRMATQYGMGILSFLQGRDHGNTAGAANITGFQSDGSGAYTSPDTNPYAVAGGLAEDSGFRKAMSHLRTLKNSGVYNEKTGVIKTPGGDFNVSDFKSASSMAAAGFSKGAIAGSMEYAKKLSSEALEKASKIKLGALTTASGFDDGGAGGMKSDSASSAEDVNYSALAQKPLPLDRDPSSLAGMQKNYHGEPIGVSADSIFLMMNRRYKVKESQDSFFNEQDMSFQK